MTTIRRTMLVLMLLTLAACGQARTIDTAHVAAIACASDGEVHAQASQYAGGQYTLNGGAPVTFTAGFDLTLDGATTWTLVVTADDGFPTFTGQAGPCRTPSTSTTTAPATTTTCPDCVINTVVITPPTTSTTTTSPPTPATFAAPGGTTTTTTVVDSTTTTAAPPVTTAVVSSTTVVPTTTCPVCTAPSAPPAPPAGLPATAGIGVNAWLGAALLVVLVGVVFVMRRRR